MLDEDPKTGNGDFVPVGNGCLDLVKHNLDCLSGKRLGKTQVFCYRGCEVTLIHSITLSSEWQLVLPPWYRPGSNQPPIAFQAIALPTELRHHARPCTTRMQVL
jgi:hypothetical protein